MSTAKNNEEIPNAHLHELMVKELQDLLGAEKQLVLGLEKMASAAADDKLKAAFRLHCQDTENHIERLKSAFGALGLPPQILGVLYDLDRKSTRLNSSHVKISYAVFCLKKKNKSIHLT